MPSGLVDAVSVLHFGSVGALEVLSGVIYPNPVVCEAVLDEITAGANRLASHEIAESVLAWDGTTDAHEVSLSLLQEVAQTRLALAKAGDAQTMHLGEAQSIVLAQQMSCIFVTDDDPAHQFATRRLGPEAVWDSIDVLRMAVANTDISAEQARRLVEQMRDRDRVIRRPHPDPLPRTYFD